MRSRQRWHIDKFTRRAIFIVASVGMFAALGAGCVGHKTGDDAADTASLVVPRANVVLISIDTLRADRLGCYGYARDTSPVIDALAAEGLRFSEAVSVTSWTLPAHATLLTGLYPAEHGLVTDRIRLPESPPTLATILSEAGYHTAGIVSHVYLGSRWGFDRGFAAFDETLGAGSPHSVVAERVVDKALKALGAWREEHGGKPLFLWLHIFDPHWAYVPPKPYDSLFDPDYEGGVDGGYASLRPHIRALRRPGESAPALADRDLAHLEALYDGEVRYVDDQLGRFFTALRDAGLWEETLVAVVSDHGEEFMEHGSLEGHQWTLFDEVVMVSGRRQAGGTCGAPRA